jgi:hypothetical protein
MVNTRRRCRRPPGECSRNLGWVAGWSRPLATLQRSFVGLAGCGTQHRASLRWTISAPGAVTPLRLNDVAVFEGNARSSGIFPATVGSEHGVVGRVVIGEKGIRSP